MTGFRIPIAKKTKSNPRFQQKESPLNPFALFPQRLLLSPGQLQIRAHRRRFLHRCRRRAEKMMGRVQKVAKKLALWHTPTFRPLMSHDDLEPILYSVGFISFPAHAPPPAASSLKPPFSAPAAPADVQWKEYAFPSSSSAEMACSGVHPPRPRLPFPIIYGLHFIAYKAFLSALECYIDPSDVYKLFHVRAMPLAQRHDRSFEKVYRAMKDYDVCGEGIYLYRRGTIVHCMLEQMEAMERRDEGGEKNNDRRLKGGGSRADRQIIMVSLDNLLPEMNIFNSRF